MFMNQVQKEFATENLLFLTIILQWQDYLIENKFWDDSNDNCVVVGYSNTTNKSKRIILPKNVPISPIVYNFKHKNGIFNVNINNNNGDKNQFAIFDTSFKYLYKQYFERTNAPLELNISYELRDKIEAHYVSLNENRTFDKTTFWDVWYDFKLVCDQVFENLMPVLVRCYKDMAIVTSTSSV